MLSKLATFSKCDVKLKYPATTLVKRGYIFQDKTGKINCCSCGFVLENLDASFDAIYTEHENWGPDCEFSKPGNFSDDKENVDKGSVTSELDKLRYTLSTDGNKEAGAVGGTSVVKNKFQVLTLSNNELNELFPNATKCRLKLIILSAQERQRRWENENQVGNDTVRRTAAAGRPETVDVTDSSDSGVYSHANSTLNCACSLPHITIQDLVQGAKHPALVSRSERRRTFVGKEHRYEHCVATIDHFVEAGFYYIGPNDNVRCFYCDGGLKNFKQNDDPWREHKRWFRDCKFVDYRENLLLGHDHPDGHPHSSSGRQTPEEQRAMFTPKRVLEQREIKARLETPIVQVLLSQGYQREHIRRALERRFAIVGDDYKSVGELVEDILKVEGHSIISSLRTGTDRPKTDAPGATNSATNASSAVVNQQSTTANPITKPSQSGDKVDGATATINAQKERDAVILSSMTAQEVSNALRNQPIHDEELKRLWSEHEQLIQSKTCKVCLDVEINTVFLPCGHLVCCDKCTPQITHCCICRSLIRGTVRALTAD